VSRKPIPSEAAVGKTPAPKAASPEMSTSKPAATATKAATAMTIAAESFSRTYCDKTQTQKRSYEQ
jgi:hypothetical protein